MTDATRTVVRIQLPVPLDVLGNLMMACSTVYPNAVMRSGDTSAVMELVIPDADRVTGTAQATAESGVSFDPVRLQEVAQSALVTSVGDVVAVALPQWISQVAVPLFNAAFAEVADADTYLELDVASSADPADRYIVMVLRPGERTAHQVLQDAERSLAARSNADPSPSAESLT